MPSSIPMHELHHAVREWYRLAARDLPWRAADATPWGILVSEVMLQQTPVARVLPVWQQWIARWPNPTALQAESPGEVVRAWGRLGYPRRALRLHEAARVVSQRHGGEVPADYADLLALPGIGSYTAAAVASFAFGRRHAVVDTNVRRVHARAVTGVALPAVSLSAAETRLAELLLPHDPVAATVWNVGVMELGALVCTARVPRCAECPLAGQCAWVAAGRPAHTGPPRRGQAWEGTDRQVRGRVLALLRTRSPASRADVEKLCDDERQLDRCVASLIHDGLIEPLRGGRYRLPR